MNNVSGFGSSTRRTWTALARSCALAIACFWGGGIVAQSTPQATNVLRPCPDTPNCVSTEATRASQRVAPVPFRDAPDRAVARAKAALLAEPRSRLTGESGDAIHGECRSFLFRFIDDVDIVVDSTERVFRFRSASRTGRGDFGVNAKRIARIAARLTP